MKQLLFRIDLDTGLYYSVMSDKHDRMLYPVLDFEHMSPENNFETKYDLDFVDNNETVPVIGTKKVPLHIKNAHREKWGLPPVRRVRSQRHLLSLVPKIWTVLTQRDKHKLLKAAGFDPKEWLLMVSGNEERVRYWVNGAEKALRIGWGLYAVHETEVHYHVWDAQKRLAHPRRKA